MKQLTGQNRAILLYLESGGSLSTIDALEKFNSFRPVSYTHLTLPTIYSV